MSLIRHRNVDHKVVDLHIPHEILLYTLLPPETVLRVSMYSMSIVVYITKVSWLKTLLLRNGEVYNIQILI